MKKPICLFVALLSIAITTPSFAADDCGKTENYFRGWQIQPKSGSTITGTMNMGEGSSFTITSGLDQGFNLVSDPTQGRGFSGNGIWCGGYTPPIFNPNYRATLFIFKNQALVFEQEISNFTCTPNQSCQDDAVTIPINYSFTPGSDRYAVIVALKSVTPETALLGNTQLTWFVENSGIATEIDLNDSLESPSLDLTGGITAEPMTWASFYYNPPATAPVSFQAFPASAWFDWNGGKATNYGNILKLNSNADIREVTWILQGPGIEPYSITHHTGSGLVVDSDAATFQIPEEQILGHGLPETGWQLTLITVDRFGNTDTLETPISSMRPIFPRTIMWQVESDDLFGNPNSVTTEHFIMQRSGRTEFLTAMAFPQEHCVFPFALEAEVFSVGKNDDPEDFVPVQNADYQFASLFVYQKERNCSLTNYMTVGNGFITPKGHILTGRNNAADDESWSLLHERVENPHAVALTLVKIYDNRSQQSRSLYWDEFQTQSGASPSSATINHWLGRGDTPYTTFIQRGVGDLSTGFEAQLWANPEPSNGPISNLVFNPYDEATPLFVSAAWNQAFDYSLDSTAVVRYGGSVIHSLTLNPPSEFPNSQSSGTPQMVDISLPGDGALAIPGEAQLELTFHLNGSNDPTTDRRLTLTLVPTQLEPDLDRITIDYIENASFNSCDGSSDLEIGLSADTESPSLTGFVWSWQWNSRFWDESSNQWATPQAGESQPWYTVGGTSAFSGLWTLIDLGNGSFSIQPAPNADPFAGIGNTFVPTTERHVTLHIKPVFSDGSEGEAVQETFLLTKIEDGNLSALEAATGQGTYTQTLHLQEGYAGSISFQAQTDAGDQSALLEIAVDGGTYTNLTNSGVMVQFQSGSVSTYQFTIPNTHALFSAMTSLGSHTVQLRVADGCAQGSAMEIQVSNGEGFVVRVHYRDHIGSTTLSRALSRQPVNQGDQAELALLVDGGNETLLLYPQEEERAHYTPWGSPILSGEQEVVHGRYTDHEYDSLSTFNYMKGRYQLPGMGIFNRPDPMRDWDWDNPASINLYQYVRNNPINGFDPTGFGLRSIVLKYEGANKVNTTRLRTLNRLASPNPKELGWKSEPYHKNHAVNVTVVIDEGDDPNDYTFTQSAIATSRDGVQNNLEGKDSPEPAQIEFDSKTNELSMIDTPGISSVGMENAAPVTDDKYWAVFSTTVTSKDGKESKTIYWQTEFELDKNGEVISESVEVLTKDEFEYFSQVIIESGK